MSFTLNKLPYAADALAPMISKEVVGFHYGKHQYVPLPKKKLTKQSAGYVAKLNELTSNTPLANKSIPELIKSRKTIPVPVFNSAAQTWNHDFYWKSLKPGAHGFEGVGEKTKRGLESSFGSMENFKKEFSAGTFSLYYSFIRACGWVDPY
jgi:Fe-Mn family superoxide dismutase